MGLSTHLCNDYSFQNINSLNMPLTLNLLSQAKLLAEPSKVRKRQIEGQVDNRIKLEQMSQLDHTTNQDPSYHCQIGRSPLQDPSYRCQIGRSLLQSPNYHCQIGRLMLLNKASFIAEQYLNFIRNSLVYP